MTTEEKAEAKPEDPIQTVADEGKEPEEEKVEKPRPKDVPAEEWNNKVEFTPEQQRRFNRLYAQVKQKDAALEELATITKAQHERLSRLERGEIDKRVKDLVSQKRKALDEGDHGKVAEIDDELIDVKLAEKERKAAKPATQTIQKTAGDDYLTPDDRSALERWASEADAEGNPVRPWANPSHPQHKRALRSIQAAVLDDEIADDFDAVLRAVDEDMGAVAKKPRPAATVLSGNPSASQRSPRKETELSADQKRVADFMGFTPKQYAEALALSDGGRVVADD